MWVFFLILLYIIISRTSASVHASGLCIFFIALLETTSLHDHQSKRSNFHIFGATRGRFCAAVLKTPWDTFPIARVFSTRFGLCRVRGKVGEKKKSRTKDHPGDRQIYIGLVDSENRSPPLSPSSGRCRYASSVKLNNIYATRTCRQHSAFFFWFRPVDFEGSLLRCFFSRRRRSRD